MISNERPSPYGRQYRSPQPPRDAGFQKPHVEESTLTSATIQIERKSYSLTIRENVRGRFLRIVEDTGGRHNSIIVPESGLEDFAKVLDEMVKASATLPAPKT